MLAFIRNFLFAIAGVALFVWLLALGAVVALVVLFLGMAVFVYMQLVRRGIVNPPAHWARYRERHTSQNQVIEVEYTVEDESDQKKD